MSETVYTLLVGPRACGKTTMGTLVRDLFHTDNVVFVDTSSILDWARQRNDPIGEELRMLRREQSRGIILPATLVFNAINAWEVEMRTRRHLAHLILAGSPRDPEQCKLWKSTRGNRVRVIHIQSEMEGVMAGVNTRQSETGCTRDDESNESLFTSYREYREKVVPGLNILNGHVLHLRREEPLNNQIEKVIGHIIAPDGVKNKLIRRLNSPQHPVRERIEQISSRYCPNKMIAA
jgi:adenylate kinase family enzyme